MELAIIVVSLLALLAIENLVTRRSDRYRKELVYAVMPTALATQAAPRGELSFDSAERALSRQLVAGQLDRADYRHADRVVDLQRRWQPAMAPAVTQPSGGATHGPTRGTALL